MLESALKVVITPARPSVGRGRRVVLDQPGTWAIMGRTAQIRLPHISGEENIFLSREAMRIGLDESGRISLQNLSRAHEATLRPWGRGSGADDFIEHWRGVTVPHRELPRGVYWARNGRTWDPLEARYGASRGNDRTSWVLLEVIYRNPLQQLAASERRFEPNAAQATYGLPDTPREWRIQDKQYRGILIYFSQYLSWPPAVDPRIPTDSTAERLDLSGGEWSRIDHLVASAALRGYSGGRAELLPWLIAEGYLKFGQVQRLAEQFGLQHLLMPDHRYGPPVRD